MEFTGFCPQGLDLLVENQMMDSPAFYEAHKAQIKELAIRPFYDLCETIKADMLAIDSAFVVTPARMVSRVRRDTRYTPFTIWRLDQNFGDTAAGAGLDAEKWSRHAV